jgi:D-alanine-D-alanine ligase
MDKIAFIFGGRSKEHEVSVLSAASVIRAVDKAKHEIAPIGIDKSGKWYKINSDIAEITSLDNPLVSGMFLLGIPTNPVEVADEVDLAFPLIHGTYGEDGTLQGLFEILDLPYAGCSVASSAISMDKIFTKELLIRAGLPVCKHSVIIEAKYIANRESELNRVSEELTFPLFVKPANMGSSVGISKVYGCEDLGTAITEALKHDSRVIIEETVVGRELETGVIGISSAQVASVGEIRCSTDFYDYDAKYREDGGTQLHIPADIPEKIRDEIKELAVTAYTVLGCDGFARVDFFYNEEAEKVYINELNSIPGFTAYSMFPLLFGASGVSYSELIERIIELGYERHSAKNSR